MEKILNRADVPVEQTWDLTPIYPNEEAFETDFSRIETLAKDFVDAYAGHLKDAKTVNTALKAYSDIQELAERLFAYSDLQVEADTSNKENIARAARTGSRMAKIYEKLAFFAIELAHLDDTVLEEASQQAPDHARFLDKIQKNKAHYLSAETEAALAAMAPTLDSPYQIYNDIKNADTCFPSFEAHGKTYAMTYNAFENRYESDPDHTVRHTAADLFYAELARHKNGTASAYNARVQQEKIEADLRGYDSVFDYLLAEQEVPRALYDRQIDVIMERLAPIMQKYATLIGRVYGIDRMTTYDLKLELDPNVSSEISYAEAADFIKDGLSILGDDYVAMLDRAFDERWIDYAENRGKSTGAFCADVYSVHPYVLSSFNYHINEVATLAHELGHAGQNILTAKHQPFLNKEMSMYAVESPSTTNELIMENYLLKKAGDDKRQRRWVLSQMVSQTYYHNFVTHLLEAAYQREVYRIVEQGGSVDADSLTTIYREVLSRFWGDAVEIKDGSALTWMRQPHYYMGLYSYTYSAGLTIGTQMALRLMKGEPGVVDQWRAFLSAGDSVDPIGLAAIAGVDITTDKPLKDTIDYIGSIVDELVSLTDELEK